MTGGAHPGALDGSVVYTGQPVLEILPWKRAALIKLRAFLAEGPACGPRHTMLWLDAFSIGAGVVIVMHVSRIFV
jgi:hypothetical protein